MSTKAMGWVYEHSPYKGSNFCIHLALADSANDMYGYELWASQTWIAEKARVSRQTVNSFLVKAVEDKLLVQIENNSKSGRPNRYRLLMPKSAPSTWSPKREWNGPTYVPEGVATDDTPPEEGVATDDTPLSPEPTPPVVRGDTNPIEPKGEPNHMLSPTTTAPSSPRGSEDSGLDKDSQDESDSTRARGADDAETGSTKPRAKWDTSGYAMELCELLVGKVQAEHGYRPKIKNTRSSDWVGTMNKLITQGPATWEEPAPIDPDKIRVMIEYVYTYGSEYEGNRDFRWADHIKSPQKLRQHWEQLRTWANNEHRKRSRAQEEGGTTDQSWMVVRSKGHGATEPSEAAQQAQEAEEG